MENRLYLKIISGTSGERLLIFAWGVISTLIILLIFYLRPDIAQLLDYKLYDRFLRELPTSGKSAPPVIVDIDEKSLGLYGQWPWPRYRTAALLEKIAAMKPSAVALDFILAEPDRTSISRVLKDIETDFGVKYHLESSIPPQRLDPQLLDNDQIFSRALSSGPFILGNQLRFSG